MSSRLSLALDAGGLVLPADGPIAVIHPRADTNLTPLPRDRCILVQPFAPDYDAWAARGYTCIVETDPPLDSFAAAIVFVTRSKAETRSLIAQALVQTNGPVVIDGAKTDGIDSLLKDIRARLPINGLISKAHGKVFWVTGGADQFDHWAPDKTSMADGYMTAPGVFSSDGVDPASKLLADSLPAKLGRTVADLGAGWGYLAARCLERADIEILHLVEADSRALNCAKANVDDPRAQYHWADVPRWTAPGKVDTVVMNPPFHASRTADPGLGRSFIQAAAAMLAPSGALWMVANRHLPYEAALTASFVQCNEVAGDNRFKVLRAVRPSRPRR